MSAFKTLVKTTTQNVALSALLSSGMVLSAYYGYNYIKREYLPVDSITYNPFAKPGALVVDVSGQHTVFGTKSINVNSLIGRSMSLTVGTNGITSKDIFVISAESVNLLQSGAQLVCYPSIAQRSAINASIGVKSPSKLTTGITLVPSGGSVLLNVVVY